MKTSASAKKSKSSKTDAKPSVKTEKIDKLAAVDLPDATPDKSKPTPKQPAQKFRRFFLWNVWLAVLYGLQGIAILLLSATKTSPLTTEFLGQDKLASSLAGETVFATASRHLADINLAQLLAVILFVIALMHVLMATVSRRRYEAGLDGSANKFRWLSNALSGGGFMVLIGMLFGITNAGTLIMLFTLTALSFIAVLVMELNLRSVGYKSRFLTGLGMIAAFVPSVVTGLVLFGAAIWGESSIPGYLYWLFGTVVVTALFLGATSYWRHKRAGKWADYLYGERIYLVVSLVINTALAWQVFVGALRP